jgi:polyisoprenoid-binding protein YceI
MKTLTKLSVIAGLLITITTAFSPKATENFKVDGGKSTITWVGKKVTGEHSGNIKIKSGTVVTEGKKLKGGSFIIDMNSMTCTDLTDPDYNSKFIGHLKSDDFFSTEKFPEAKLDITSVTPVKDNNYTVKGNLTIKGVTKPVEFPATVTSDSKTVKANADITVDRTKYDIKYGSGTFFDNLGDKAIEDNFTLKVQLVASK